MENDNVKTRKFSIRLIPIFIVLVSAFFQCSLFTASTLEKETVIPYLIFLVVILLIDDILLLKKYFMDSTKILKIVVTSIIIASTVLMIIGIYQLNRLFSLGEMELDSLIESPESSNLETLYFLIFKILPIALIAKDIFLFKNEDTRKHISITILSLIISFTVVPLLLSIIIEDLIKDALQLIITVIIITLLLAYVIMNIRSAIKEKGIDVIAEYVEKGIGGILLLPFIIIKVFFEALFATLLEGAGNSNTSTEKANRYRKEADDMDRAADWKLTKYGEREAHENAAKLREKARQEENKSK